MEHVSERPNPIPIKLISPSRAMLQSAVCLIFATTFTPVDLSRTSQKQSKLLSRNKLQPFPLWRLCTVSKRSCSVPILDKSKAVVNPVPIRTCCMHYNQSHLSDRLSLLGPLRALRKKARSSISSSSSCSSSAGSDSSSTGASMTCVGADTGF